MIGLVLGVLLQLPAPTLEAWITPILGEGATVLRLEADGDPATPEWLANGTDPNGSDYGLVRVVTVRGGRVCMTPWLDPRPTTTEPVRVWVQWQGSVMGFGSLTASGIYRETPIPLPVCG